MDATKLGEFAAQFMEQLQVEWSDECVIRDIAIVVNLDEKDESFILTGCTDDRPWVAKALYYEAIENIDATVEAYDPRGEDDE